MAVSLVALWVIDEVVGVIRVIVIEIVVVDAVVMVVGVVLVTI